MKKTFRRLKLLCAALIPLLLLGGCSNYVEVNDKSFVIAMGVDKGKNELLRFSFLFTSPEAGGSEEGGGSKSKDKDLVTVEAPTVYSALRLLNTFKSKQIDVAHTKLIIFSRSLAEKGIGSYVTDFVNTRGFRPNIYLCVAEDSAEDFFKSIDPKQEIFIERYIERLFSKVTNSSVNDAYLYYNYFSSIEGTGGSLLPLVGVSGKEAAEEAEDEFENVAPDDFSVNYIASQVPVDKKDAAVLCGYAVLKDEKMIGTLGLLESDLVRMLSKNMPSNEFSVYFPPKDKRVSVSLRQTSFPKIKVSTGASPEISIEIPIKGELSGIGSALKSRAEHEEFSAYLSEQLTNKLAELLRRSQTEFGADVFGLGNYGKKNFLTYSQWQLYNWKEKYKTAAIYPTVTVEINDYGELKSSPKKKQNGGA